MFSDDWDAAATNGYAAPTTEDMQSQLLKMMDTQALKLQAQIMRYARHSQCLKL
jgi:hypothetical protein